MYHEPGCRQFDRMNPVVRSAIFCFCVPNSPLVIAIYKFHSSLSSLLFFLSSHLSSLALSLLSYPSPAFSLSVQRIFRLISANLSLSLCVFCMQHILILLQQAGLGLHFLHTRARPIIHLDIKVCSLALLLCFPFTLPRPNHSPLVLRG